MKRLLLLALIVPLAAQAADEAPSDGSATGLANPASQYCLRVGGTLEIRREANGEVGYCHLPNGRVVEEWALFRAAAK